MGSIVLKTKQYVDEVIVVDDGSSDRTSEIARLAGATIIKHPENKGKGSAIQSILNEVKKNIPDVLVLLDADSQHNPDEIPQLIKPILDGNDMVIGSRELVKRNIPTYRRFGQNILLRLTRTLTRSKISDSESGFRAFSGKAIAELELTQKGFAIESEMIAVAEEKKLKVTEVHVSAIYTKDGSTLNPIRHGLGVLTQIIEMISEKRPLYFFGIGGLIFTVVGLLTGIKALFIVFSGGPAVNGWTLSALLLLLVGIFSTFTGIILNALIKSSY